MGTVHARVRGPAGRVTSGWAPRGHVPGEGAPRAARPEATAVPPARPAHLGPEAEAQRRGGACPRSLSGDPGAGRSSRAPAPPGSGAIRSSLHGRCFGRCQRLPAGTSCLWICSLGEHPASPFPGPGPAGSPRLPLGAPAPPCEEAAAIVHVPGGGETWGTRHGRPRAQLLALDPRRRGLGIQVPPKAALLAPRDVPERSFPATADSGVESLTAQRSSVSPLSSPNEGAQGSRPPD